MKRKKNEYLVSIILILILVIIASYFSISAFFPKNEVFQVTDNTQNEITINNKEVTPTNNNSDNSITFKDSFYSKYWKLSGDVKKFNSKNLYEKINGHAESYISFGFKELAFVSYTDKDNNFIDIYVYIMDNEDSALGIFQNEKSEKTEPVKIADGAYKSGNSIFFHKNNFYAQVLADGVELKTEFKDLPLDIAKSLVKSIEEKNNNSKKKNTELFPESDIKENAKSFIKENAFGLEAVKNIKLMKYSIDKDVFNLFYNDFSKNNDGKSMFTATKKMLDEYADKIDEKKNT